VTSKIGRSSALTCPPESRNSRVERRTADSRRGFLIGSASLLAAPAIARADWSMPVKIVEYSDGATMDVLREQKVKNLLAAFKKSLDGFLDESGFTAEQVLHGKSYEQWCRDYEARLRKEFGRRGS
jgi:hypothetical protein